MHTSPPHQSSTPALRPVIGWDIGGAHVKAVCLDEGGQVCFVQQQSCALWKGLSLLETALDAVMAAMPPMPAHVMHVATMTGELVDLFQSREQGVQEIARCMQQRFPHLCFYAALPHGEAWVSSVATMTAAVASMNWHASARCLLAELARKPADDAPSESSAALLIDIGSTTTDVTVGWQGAILPAGMTDAARMQQGSLLYSGVVRTPLMALGPTLTWQGQAHGVAAEYFATTADVYRLLGQLPAALDTADTADGQDKSALASMRRLARMVGHDVGDLPQAAWFALAQAFAAQQQERMLEVCKQQLQRAERQGVKPATMIAFGAGAFLAQSLAEQLGLAHRTAQSLIVAQNAAQQSMAAVCFPAYAVARLWQMQSA